jgi:DNA polymerase-4
MADTDSAWPRVVAHADMDAFYAAIEQMDNPDLRGKPILVGPPSGRGVVLTASYEARPFKVGSAMPMARAKQMCPQAIVVPPRFERYTEISKTVMGVFATFSPKIEAISLDEAFIDLTGAERLMGDPRKIGQALKRAVREATGGLTVSVGISGTKFVAKVASDFDKPDGLTIVPPDEARAWLAPMPVSRLWGAGPVTVEKLHALGLKTIGDVAACQEDGPAVSCARPWPGPARRRGATGVEEHRLGAHAGARHLRPRADQVLSQAFGGAGRPAAAAQGPSGLGRAGEAEDP